MKPFYDIGRYEVEITEQGFTKAGTGNNQFVLKFVVKGKVDPADDSALIAVDEQNRTYFRVLTEKTIPYFQEDLTALGVEIASFGDLDPNVAGFIDLTGKKVDMRCGRKNNLQGESVEEWSLARAGGGKALERIAATEVKALDRLFGKHLKKTAPAAGRTQRGPVPVAAKPQTAEPGGVAVDDDDVPF